MNHRYIFAFAMLLNALTACAQNNVSNVKDKDMAKLVKKPALRVSLPQAMASDREAGKLFDEMPKMDSVQRKQIMEALERRYDENVRLSNYLVSKDKKNKSEESLFLDIERENVRYKELQRQNQFVTECNMAMARPMPSGNLVSISYSCTGMMYDPFMPVEIQKKDDGTVATQFGKLPQKAFARENLEVLRNVIEQEQIYRLLPSYEIRQARLPDIEQIRLLDGEHFYVNILFSDGTKISSYGYFVPKSLRTLDKTLRDMYGEIEGEE